MNECEDGNNGGCVANSECINTEVGINSASAVIFFPANTVPTHYEVHTFGGDYVPCISSHARWSATTVGDSGLICCVPCYACDGCRAVSVLVC